MITTFIAQLNARQPLSADQVRQAVDWLAEPTMEAGDKADFLTALAQKGETPEEIAAFARALREKSHPLPLDPATRAGEILDIVGTGGDRLGTINISTTAALICAAAGVTVAKHGNRAVTSQAGSADVLEALDIPIDFVPGRRRGHAAGTPVCLFICPELPPRVPAHRTGPETLRRPGAAHRLQLIGSPLKPRASLDHVDGRAPAGIL